MNNCELCKSRATTYCESDQASLCWGCDAKVHAANFLVARHSRTLLCHICNSLTPWKASGSNLGHTVSVCETCLNRQQQYEGQSQEETTDEDDDDEEDDEVEGENQVVPWSSIASTPPPASSSSSSGEISACSFKRRREEDEQNGSLSQREYCTTSRREAAGNESTKADGSESVAIIAEPPNQRNKAEISEVDWWGSCSRGN
ncbi:zinc finger protein CONSTANS-LIKE 3-like isoform X2 [Mangifera indica]|uniref:zinc finger protein CONSTANS-LIKE 3-like isoform X2 n=1 Tax=Mangifera indica TaxID=29780 RepID=UPI001CFBC0F9|nr:zinc finger protein CONSTANS-LIKE 3-like isoform X2 [Mangifera indica]